MTECEECNKLITKLTKKQLGGFCSLNEVFCPEHLEELFKQAK